MIEITEGDILVGGRSVRETDENELRRHIGYVIQQIGLFPHRTIAENIATVPKLLGWDKRRTNERVRRAARPDRPRAGARPPLPGAAVRRPAPARRRGPRARRRPAGDADGRAVRRDRPDQPRAAAERVPAPAGRAPQDRRLRHPRHRRGDQDGRPHRGHAGGRPPRPVRARRPSCSCTRPTRSSRTSSAPTARSSALALQRVRDVELLPARDGATRPEIAPDALLRDALSDADRARGPRRAGRRATARSLGVISVELISRAIAEDE